MRYFNAPIISLKVDEVETKSRPRGGTSDEDIVSSNKQHDGDDELRQRLEALAEEVGELP
jgi:hypothetical protein